MFGQLVLDCRWSNIQVEKMTSDQCSEWTSSCQDGEDGEQSVDENYTMTVMILCCVSVFECLNVWKLKLPLVVGVTVKRDSRASEPI